MMYIIYSNWEGCAWDTVGISFGYRREDNRIWLYESNNMQQCVVRPKLKASIMGNAMINDGFFGVPYFGPNPKSNSSGTSIIVEMWMKYEVCYWIWFFFVELHVGIYNASAGLQRFDFGELWEMLCKRRVAIEEVRKNCGRSTYKLYIYTMIISHNYI